VPELQASPITYLWRALEIALIQIVREEGFWQPSKRIANQYFGITLSTPG